MMITMMMSLRKLNLRRPGSEKSKPTFSQFPVSPTNQIPTFSISRFKQRRFKYLEPRLQFLKDS